MHDDATAHFPSRRVVSSRAERGSHRVTRAIPPGTGRGALSEIYGVGPRITHIDRAIIRNYFQDRGISLPPERRRHARQPTLPARLSPQVSQNALPRDLERKLSQLPEDCERVLVGRDVLLVDSKTRSVVDILHHAGTPGV